jgi:hypothetical protein
MASHFSTIGFKLRSQEEFYELAMRAAQQGEALPSSAGEYVRWGDESGAELWIQINHDRQVVGLTPHYKGKSRVRVVLTHRIGRPHDTPLDGAFHGWADPTEDTVESGAYPFVFDAPEAALHDGLTLPVVVTVQIAAFGHQLTVFPDEAAYYASQTQPVFAAESFIPSGLFMPAMEEASPPRAEAIFTGRIVDTAMFTNAKSGERYAWALVRTLGGEFDVVADLDIVEGTLVINGILSGVFWLSGRILGNDSTPQ